MKCMDRLGADSIPEVISMSVSGSKGAHVQILARVIVPEKKLR